MAEPIIKQSITLGTLILSHKISMSPQWGAWYDR